MTEPEKQLTQTEEALLQRAYGLAALHATTLDITTTHELPILLEKIVKRAIRLLDGTGGGLYLCDYSDKVVRCVVSINAPHDCQGQILQYGEKVIGEVAQDGKPRIIDVQPSLGSSETNSFHAPNLLPAIISPMRWQNTVTGVIQVISNNENRKFSREDLELLSMFANQAAIAVENTRLLNAANNEIKERKAAEEELHNLNNELTHYVELLQRRNSEIMMINEMGDMLQSCLTVDDAYAVIGDFVEKLFPQSIGAIYRYSENRDHLDIITSWGEQSTLKSIIYPEDCWGLRRNKIHQINSPQDRLRCKHLPTFTSNLAVKTHICIPLVGSEMTHGLFQISFCAIEDNDQVRNLVHTVSERATLAISNLRLREELHEQTIRDPLTGLYNRRYLEKTLERELSRAIRHQGTLGILMIDVDRLKSINDLYGHAAGDVLLREIGTFLKLQTRTEDIPCRYGGDEFIIVLNESNLEGAYQRANELQIGIQELEINYLDVTLDNNHVSIGVACYPQHGDSIDRLLKCADLALYQAKNHGRIQVYLAEINNC